MNNVDDKTSKEYKMKKYHSDEIRLILFICATDLTNYKRDDLIMFAECIEGRIEVLLTTEYLKSIRDFINVENTTMNKLLDLKTMLQRQYSEQWHMKMKDSSWTEITKLSLEVLEMLEMEYQDPMAFMENNLDEDWV